MKPPPVRYALSGDVNVAYQVIGAGPIDFVIAPGTASHLDLDWEWPARMEFALGLAELGRVIRFDKRGTGLSDRPTDAATLEERTDDIRAVMDAAGCEQAVVIGASEGANMACLFAATFPERTRALVVWGGQARWTQTDDYPWGMSADQEAALIDLVSREWPSVEYILGPGAGLGANADPEFVEWFLRYARAAASPAAIVALERMNAAIDVRDILPAIHVPTLVLNRTGDPVASVHAARDLANSIPGARFVEFPGDTHSFVGIAGDLVAEISEFVTGTRAHPIGSRMLATLLFLDVIGSTERVVELGDASWRALLDELHTTATATVRLFGGEIVDRAGDGLLARFDGPTRALRCAIELRRRSAALGVELRAGAHTGEVEVTEDAVRGIAVHIAARIAALAETAEVLVSGTVRDLVAGSSLTFVDRGLHALKGVPEPRHVYALSEASA